jgi:uncharacterized RDD family membrane protein YckC
VGWIASQAKPFAVLLMPLLWLAAIAYEPVFHAKYGRTIGKFVLRIKVVDLQGNAIGWRRAMIRSSVSIGISAYWIYGTGAALFSLPPADFHGQGWTELYQTLKHDFSPAYETFGLYLAVWFWLEFFSTFMSPTRRAVHDYLAGTAVIFRAERFT